MHTQEKDIQRRRGGWRIDLGGAVGLVLYAVTLVVEAVFGVAARWLPAFLAVSALKGVASLFVELHGWYLDAELIALAAAVSSPVYSLASLLLPHAGPKTIGAREGRAPTASEKRVLAEAMATLRGVDASLASPRRVYVLEDGMPQGFSRGLTVFWNRGTFECPQFPGLLGHELGHSGTLDGRITEALGRAVFWEDPLGPTEAEVRDPGLVAHMDSAGGFWWGAARWSLRLAGGSMGQVILRPAWAAYWRRREYAADRFAAKLGQAEDLAAHLEEYRQPFDVSPVRRWLKLEQHPPVAQRIERLRGEWEGGRLHRLARRIWKWGQERWAERS